MLGRQRIKKHPQHIGLRPAPRAPVSADGAYADVSLSLQLSLDPYQLKGILKTLSSVSGNDRFVEVCTCIDKVWYFESTTCDGKSFVQEIGALVVGKERGRVVALGN